MALQGSNASVCGSDVVTGKASVEQQLEFQFLKLVKVFQ